MMIRNRIGVLTAAALIAQTALLQLPALASAESRSGELSHWVMETLSSCGKELRDCQVEGLEVRTLHARSSSDPAAPAEHINTLDNTKLRKLLAIARQQTDTWIDTLMEGGYLSDRLTRLDRVEGILFNGETVGLRIIYSQKAWEITQCSFQFTNPETLNQCPTGRISEASFVSPDMKGRFIDGAFPAEFLAD